MSSGKPKKAKVVAATSPYQDVNSATYSSPFASATSSSTPYTDSTGATHNQIGTSINLSPDLQQASGQATSGINNQLGYLNRSPEQQVAFATSGNDPYYNALNIQANNDLSRANNNAKVNAQRTGGLNSTALGATLGQISNDDLLRRNTILTNSLGYGNQNSLNSLNANLGTMNGIANLTYPLASAANNNLLTAFNQTQGLNQTNAAAQNAANMQYANQQNSQGSPLGSILGTGLSLAGTALAPFTGGLSMPIGSALGGAVSGGMNGGWGSALSNGLGGALSGALGMFGGGGSSAMPSYGQSVAGSNGMSYLTPFL